MIYCKYFVEKHRPRTNKTKGLCSRPGSRLLLALGVRVPPLPEGTGGRGCERQLGRLGVLFTPVGSLDALLFAHDHFDHSAASEKRQLEEKIPAKFVGVVAHYDIPFAPRKRGQYRVVVERPLCIIYHLVQKVKA